MAARWILCLVSVAGMLCAAPALPAFQTTSDAWYEISQEVGRGMHTYFDRQFHNSAY